MEIRGYKQASEQVITYPHPAVKLTNGKALAQAQFLHREHLSSVRAITNSAGAVVERSVSCGGLTRPHQGPRSPLIFGEQAEWLSASQPAPKTKGWIGERFDTDAGLQYLNARYYDPSLGMFLQPDWWEVTKPGVGTNRFIYSFNDPVNLTDKNGNIIDTIWDVGSVLNDLREIDYGYYTGDNDMVASGMMNLTIDAGSARVPGLPASSGRLLVAAGRKGKEFSDKTKSQLEKLGLYSGKGSGEQVHHIGMASGGGPAGDAVREILSKSGIDLGSVQNGVGLVHHSGNHATKYSVALLERLREKSPAQVAEEMAAIQRELNAID